MSIPEAVFLFLAVAGLSAYLVCHAARPGRMSVTTLRRLRLDDRAFLETRRLLAELYVARILSLCGGALFFGLWARLHGFGVASSSGLALAYAFVTALLLAPLMLRSPLSTDSASDRIVSFLRRPLALSGALLELLPGLSLRGAWVVHEPAQPPARLRYAVGIAAAQREPGSSTSQVEPIASPYGRDLLKLLLRLRERHISEVMVPRVDMVCAQETSTIRELAELAIDCGHTRVPIFRDTIDSISGYVTAKEVVLKLHKGGGEEGATSIARRPVFVSPQSSIEHCLQLLQREHAALAIVADSSGRTAGLVTLEDILKEVVGDLYQECEGEEPAYRMIDEGTAQVRANVKVGDLKEVFGAAPAADPGLSLGEYVRGLLSAEVTPGDRASDEKFVYRVSRMMGKTIWSVTVERKV